MKLIAVSIAALLAASAGAAVVPNGDFSAGNTGFTSDYTYGPAAGELLTGPPQAGAGYYAVVSNANFSHPSFTSFGDHTTGTGLYLVANGATTAGKAVYQSAPIAVTAGKSYSFSAYFANAYPANPADMQFDVARGAGAASAIGAFAIPGGSGVWNNGAFTFNSGTATSVTLSFVDLNLAANGNDFAIDDIKLTAVPDAPTWATMLGGFALVGLGLRRRAVTMASAAA